MSNSKICPLCNVTGHKTARSKKCLYHGNLSTKSIALHYKSRYLYTILFILVLVWLPTHHNTEQTGNNYDRKINVTKTIDIRQEYTKRSLRIQTDEPQYKHIVSPIKARIWFNI